MAKHDRDEYAAHRWALAVESQASRMIEAREAIDREDSTSAERAAAWRWLDDAHFLLIAAGQLARRVEKLGWENDYPKVNWTYLTHLRNAWEHDDDRGLYRRDYRWPHGSGVWSAGQPGFIDELNVANLLSASAHIRARVEEWAADEGEPSSGIS